MNPLGGVNYLKSVRPIGDDGSMEDHVLHVGESAYSIEQQLGAVVASYVYHRISLLVASFHRDPRPETTARGRFLPLPSTNHQFIVRVVGHHPMQPAIGAGKVRGDIGMRSPVAAAEHIAEVFLDVGEAGRVGEAPGGGTVCNVDNAGNAGVMRPSLRSHDVAVEVGQHGGDLGEEARPVAAHELNGSVLASHRLDARLRRPICPQRLFRNSTILIFFLRSRKN